MLDIPSQQLNRILTNTSLPRYRLLLKHGACVDDVTEFGDTCGHLAAYRGHVSVLRTLLQFGLSTDVKNGRGQTMLQVAEQCHRQDIIDLLDTYTYYSC